MPTVQHFVGNVGQPEGPVSLPGGDWVVTAMSGGDLVWVSADGQSSKVIARTGRPNGVARSVDGALWVAESLNPCLLRVGAGTEPAVVATGTPQLPFLWPNDVCFGPDGALYLTDSGVPVAEFRQVASTPAAHQIPIDGRLFRVDPVSGRVDLLDRGLAFANGIAVGPDGDLFVSETLSGNIFRYDIGRQPRREFFANVTRRPPATYGRVAGPDGMAFDNDGRLLVAVLEQGEIVVVDPNGQPRETIGLPGSAPTNVAFGPPGSFVALITEASQDELLLMSWVVDGLPLAAPDISFAERSMS